MDGTENELWQELCNMFERSDREILWEMGSKEQGEEALCLLRISQKSAMGSIILHTSGINIDNWIRILGQESKGKKGILSYNLIDEEGAAKKIEKMLIVATDIVGGIFAINAGLFQEGVGDIWYFAPDTLMWETLEMKYSEFIAWAVLGNLEEFYADMRWSTWKEDVKKATFDEAILIYPFLWSSEMEIEKASKKIVPMEELFQLNLEQAKSFGRME